MNSNLMPQADRWLGKTSALAVALAIGTAVLWPIPRAEAQITMGTGSGTNTGSSSQSDQDSQSSSSTSSSSDSYNPYASSSTQQPYNVNQDSNSNSLLSLQQLMTARTDKSSALNELRKPAEPGQFQLYVGRLLGRDIPRFGDKLVLPGSRDFAAPAEATVPPDYTIQPGDKIEIALAGSMEGSVERTVDTNGRIFLEGVGPVKVAGVRHADLRDVVARAIGTQFRGFTVSVNIKELRGIRVFVTGFANNPGAFTVSSLSTLANAVFQAGGPATGGSWRGIKLYRNGQEVKDFDLYALMRGGSRVDDAKLENGDVLFIPPAGNQVAVIGAVQDEAIYEARSGESIADLLTDAGGPNTVGDRSRIVLYRTGADAIPGPQEYSLAQAASIPSRPGDIIQVLATGTLALPTDRQSALVRVEGEVNKPGIYYVTPGTSSQDIIALAGGLTPRAYPFGTKFTRQSVMLQQQDAYKEALQQLEIALASAPLSADTSIAQTDRDTQVAAARAVLQRLREAKPDGRVVLQMSPEAQAVPGQIALENNDSVYVPPKATTIGVFGSVYRPASFLLDDQNRPQRIRDYIAMAGGSLRSADRGGIFVVRANGEVISKKKGALDVRALPGDVVFVPVKTQANPFWARFKDITTTLFGLGLSAATVVAVTQ